MIDHVQADGPETDDEELAEEEGGSGIPMTASQIVAQNADDEDDNEDGDEDAGDDVDADEDLDEDATDDASA